MSNNNWQPPSHNGRNTQPPRTQTGGLLSNYTNLKSPPSQPLSSQPLPPGRQFSPVATPRNVYNSPPQSQMPVHNPIGLVQQWSDRFAALTGHPRQPPAPYLQRYHAPAPSASRPLPSPVRRRWQRSRALRIAMQMRARRERWQRTHPNMNHVLSGLLIAITLMLVITGVTGTAYGYTYYQGQLPRLQELAKQTISQTTHIYDRNGVTLYEVYDARDESPTRGRRTPVKLSDIPQVMQDAMIATEDSTFYDNTGIDMSGILRSVVLLFQHASVQGGGSTITQQVVKNLTGDKDATFARKIPEAALAIALTQNYPKQKILEMYFNVAPFGPLDLGIESAVEEYFRLMPTCDSNFKCTPGVTKLNLNPQTGKNDPLLGLARASFLAGLPQNPTSYYPPRGESYRNRALLRQQIVLGRMIDLHVNIDGLGVVTPALAQQAEALTQKMTFKAYTDPKHAPHFVDWIVDKVETALGNGDPVKGVQAFITGGFQIRTTINLELENYVERIVKQHLTASPSLDTQEAYDPNYPDTVHPPLNTAYNAHTSAVVVMNAHTGEILAMNGSADYNDPTNDRRISGVYNAADPLPNPDGTAPGRGAGSSFKPFVYATAFEMGWYPGMVIPDYRTFFPNEGQGAGVPIPTKREENDGHTHLYAPADFDWEGRWDFSGKKSSTVRQALQESQNVGAMKAMKFAGPENVLNMVHRLGLTQLNRTDISWALGTENVTVLQMTGAYQTFANGGKRIPPQGILDIWDNYGHNLFHYDPANPPAIQVVSPQVAFLLTSVLTDEQSRRPEFGSYHTLSFTDLDPNCPFTPSTQQCAYAVAAKTGTTNNFVDTWTMGYTPNVVVGSWTGNANNESMKNILGISGAGTIWHSVIKAANGYCGQGSTYYEDGIACPPPDLVQKLGITQDRQFVPPSGVHLASVSNVDGLQGGGVYDYMIDGQDPQQAGSIFRKPNDPFGFGNR